MHTPKIVGIVNITTDSFSDGGKFLEPGAAVTQAQTLADGGADIIELGAASSNPNAGHVPPELEIERLSGVLSRLDTNVCVSIDTAKPEVQRWALAQRVGYLNDIKGFPDESVYEDLAASETKLVVMHCISDIEKAVRAPKTVSEVFDSIYTFFDKRLPALEAAGVSRERLILDPGMGFFLASNPEPSLAVLAHTAQLKKDFGIPVMISVSRKSFLRNFDTSTESDIGVRTLAAELFAAGEGADYIRTHDAAALREALRTIGAIEAAQSDKKALR